MQFWVRTHQPYMPGQGARATYADTIFRDKAEAEAYLARVNAKNEGTGKWSQLIEPCETVWSYGQDGRWIDESPTREQDADQVTAFLGDGRVAASVSRTVRNKWRIDASDYASSFTATMFRKRYDSADTAMDAAMGRMPFFWARVDEF